MTDGEAVAIARRIRKLNEEACDLSEKLREHENGDEMIEALEQNECLTLASAECAISHHLLHPERWTIEHGISLKFGAAQHGVQPTRPADPVRLRS